MEPRGILRNKESDAPAHSHESASGDLDRQEVIRNTRYNAQLVSESSKGDRIRAQIAQARLHNDDDDANGVPSTEHLKWDEINLYKTEQEKAATMKIDEPKTPYEGGFDPTGEYYQEDETTEAIPDFNLGEGQFEASHELSQSLNGGQVLENDVEEVEDEDEEEEEEEETPLLAEERHQKFENMRKAHYHNAANPLKQKIAIPDDDEDNLGPENDENEDDDVEEDDEE